MNKTAATSTESGNATPTVQTTATPTPTPQRVVVDGGQPVEVNLETGKPTPATTAATTVETADPTKATKTFTQEQIDAIIAARLESERKKFADYDDLKAKVQAAEDAQKTEAQKVAERLSELEATNQRLTAERQEMARKNAIIAAASAVGLDAEAAIALVDAKQLQFDDQGNATNVADLVKAVVERFPGLLKRGAPTVPVVNPSGAQQPVGRTDDDRRREYFGGGVSPIWTSGGVKMPTSLE
jgi:hypothetical protein